MRAQLAKDATEKKKKQKRRRNKERSLDALQIEKPEDSLPCCREAPPFNSLDEQLLGQARRNTCTSDLVPGSGAGLVSFSRKPNASDLRLTRSHH